MRVNSEENVDVRFFGAHDRAWIPIKDVFLYSEEAPVAVKVRSSVPILRMMKIGVESFNKDVRLTETVNR